MNLNLETRIFLGIAVGTLLAVGIAGVFLGRGNTGSSQVLASAAVLVPENAHNIGPNEVKVTVVEFSDFQCPACKVAEPIVQQVLDKYKDKIRFIYRNYPLSSHEFGMVAAQAAEAASKQSKFWEMHKLLFAKSPDLSKDKLFEYAKSLNLDMNQFTKDFDSSGIKSAITKDQDDGNAVSVEATPTFFINGTKFTGVLTVSQFETEINLRLK